MKKIFDLYSQYYDLLYQEKDYEGEVKYIDSLIKAISKKSTSLLDVGCGTGKHDFHFAELGYKVHGVDLSDQMIEVATSKLQSDYSSQTDKLNFSSGDSRTFNLGRKFDVAVSLFHVISYQTSNQDLIQTFSTISNHLEKEGLFIFDFWYGPGVLNDLPSVRVKRLENESIKVTRITEPVLEVNNNIVNVNFEVQITNKSDLSGQNQIVKEVHSMRYLFLPEIKMMLEQAGLEFHSIKTWMGTEEPSLNTWYSVIICKKN